MDDTVKRDTQMTVIEAVEVLEHFKQRIVDEKYDVLMEEGECEMKVPFEVLEALEVTTYYINSESEDSSDL